MEHTILKTDSCASFHEVVEFCRCLKRFSIDLGDLYFDGGRWFLDPVNRQRISKTFEWNTHSWKRTPCASRYEVLSFVNPRLVFQNTWIILFPRWAICYWTLYIDIGSRNLSKGHALLKRTLVRRKISKFANPRCVFQNMWAIWMLRGTICFWTL